MYRTRTRGLLSHDLMYARLTRGMLTLVLVLVLERAAIAASNLRRSFGVISSVPFCTFWTMKCSVHGSILVSVAIAVAAMVSGCGDGGIRTAVIGIVGTVYGTYGAVNCNEQSRSFFAGSCISSQSVSLVKTNCAAASYDFLCWRAKTKRDEFDGELSRKKVNESGKFERASKVVFLFL
jgi:hypothetical protein